jgi:hypothetical protein
MRLCKTLPGVTQEFVRSVPDNFRALLTGLEQLGYPMSLEYVYDLCPGCYHVYRLSKTRDTRTHTTCPDCHTSRYQVLPNGKKRARLQVSSHSK